MISLNLKRPPGGGAILIVDARQFHDYLRTLGCVNDSAGQYLANKPYVYGSGRMVDVDNDALTSNVLVKLGGPHTIDLTAIYGAPPNADRIFKLVDRDALQNLARSVVDHYRPIEIQVSIIAKRPAVRSVAAEGEADPNAVAVAP